MAVSKNFYEFQQQKFDLFKSQDPETGKFDVTFDIGGKIVYANKYVLITASSTFDSMLSDRWNKNKDEPIKIDNYSYDDFYQFITFLYSAQCELNDDNIHSMVDMAEYFQVGFFKTYCIEYLSKVQVSNENAFQLLDLSNKYSMVNLKASIHQFITNNFVDFVNSDGFLKVGKAVIFDIIILNKDKIEPEDLFQAAYKWTENQAQSLYYPKLNKGIKAEISDFLPYIRFKQMELSFLHSFVVPLGFIFPSLKDLSEILCNCKPVKTNVKVTNSHGQTLHGFVKDEKIIADIKTLNVSTYKFSHAFLWDQVFTIPSTPSSLKKRDDVKWCPKKYQRTASLSPTDISVVSKNLKDSGNSWKNSKNNFGSKTLKNLSNNFQNETTEKEEENQKRWKNSGGNSSTKNASTLSLHIAAYENSIEASSNETGNSMPKFKDSKILAKSLSSSTKFQDNFEFPRQNEDKDSNVPEIMQFSASQQLFSPNASNNDQSRIQQNATLNNPSSSMFRKPKNRNNIRQRQRDISDEEGGGGGAAKVKIEVKEEPTTKSSNKNVVNVVESEEEEEAAIIFSKPKKPPAMLSFNDDEGVDVEEFKIKKPSHKKRTEKLARRQKELEEREKEQKKAAAAKSHYHNDNVEEIGIVVKNSIKVSASSEAYQEKVEDDPIIIAAIEQDLETRLKFGGFDGIPDAKAVYEAKKRREQMRRDGTKSKLQTGASNDDNGFIPLSTNVTKIEKVAHSRLVREDENDMSDEDGENDGQFYSSKSLLISEEERRRKEQEEFLRLEGDSDDEEEGHRDDDDDQAAADEEAKRRAQESDDEFAEWEKHQIRKAVSTQKVKQMRQENYAINNEPPPEVVNLEDGEEDMDIEIIEEPMTGLKGGNVPSCSQTSLTEIMEKLRTRVQDKQDFIDSQKSELQRKEANVAENLTLIAGIEADYPILREKYRTYQEMRIFTKDLLDCINEKIDTINEVENRIFSMWKSRNEKMMKRRRADVQDQYQRCFSAALNRPYQPAADVIQRETNCNGRRSSRRHQREKAGIQDRHHDGLSSDEEEPESQKFEYQRTIADGLELAADVFHDASEEFTDIGNIMSRFVDWILVDQKSFDDAYVSLCLPKLLSPFIRLELLDWDPLKDVSKPLHHYSWYQTLLQVGTNKIGFDLENPTIVGLIPAIIEKLFIPRLTKIINEQWDPFSLSQSRNLSYFISLLVDETPTLTAEAKSIKNLLKAIMSKFKSTIKEDTFVPLYSKEALQNSSTGCYAFLDRRFWSLIKLIRSANCFQQILSKEALHEIIIDGIINRGCVLALQLSPKDSPKTLQKCYAIIDEIPVEWLPPTDSAPYRSLLAALKLISEANDSRQRTKIDKFIEIVESS